MTSEQEMVVADVEARNRTRWVRRHKDRKKYGQTKKFCPHPSAIDDVEALLAVIRSLSSPQQRPA